MRAAQKRTSEAPVSEARQQLPIPQPVKTWPGIDLATRRDIGVRALADRVGPGRVVAGAGAGRGWGVRKIEFL